MKIGRLKIIRWLWALIYRKYLWDYHYKSYSKVIRVKGWRTALIEMPKVRYRKTISPCFLIFK